ncbi:MAG: hypothetical protein KJO21_01880 [Verrucomicrobiae bacterium]|nr:hypothetical protein [Verrucomicrobiae bacterium]NNJ42286.1 hypothetical protein [Akkermansiaceae bacterium]
MSTPPIHPISDFPDKLNPMLVKELRQGLRGIGFVVLFISLQALLCFILLITATVASYENAGSQLSRVIFFFFSFAVLLIQPLRGISALSTEIKDNTIDLLCLTRLSAWRITYGKWVSIVSQSALFLTAIIPYLILRYFFGDMQMLAEILLLLSTFLLSATFTAITVGFSGLTSALIRVILPITAAAIGFMILVSMYFGGRNNYQEIIQLLTLESAASTFTFLGLICICIYTAWMGLDLGTSIIAPIAENRATLRRIVSLGLITTTLLVFSFTGVGADVVIPLCLVLCIPVSMISLTENSRLVPPIVAPFTRRGVLGKSAGRLLYPGRATGLIFVLTLYLLMHGLLLFYKYRGITVDPWDVVVLNSFFAILFFALVLTHIFARKYSNRIGIFMLFICSQFLISAIIYACEEWSSKLDVMPYFFWIPTSFSYNDNMPSDALLTASYFNVVLYATIGFVTTRPLWKHIRATEQQVHHDP